MHLSKCDFCLSGDTFRCLVTVHQCYAYRQTDRQTDTQPKGYRKQNSGKHGQLNSYQCVLIDEVTEQLLCVCLQSVQNASARLITRTPRYDHISPVLRQLHWRPVRHRVTFKIAVLVFQCLTGQAPAYLADDCQLTSDVGTRRLRSTDTVMCVVRCSNKTFGDWCFASAGQRLWNRLPAHLRQCDSLGQFKRLMKTHLFGS